LKLDFVIPGFSKCGTTTLCSILGNHPQIRIADGKEPGFFSHNFHRGMGWYESLFGNQSSEAKLYGDGSTFYSSFEFSALAAERISSHNPDAKLIFMARDPIARLESSFREMHHSGWEYGVHPDRDINLAVKKISNMLNDTKYWYLLNQFRKYFKDKNIQILFLEDWQRDPFSQCKMCFEFLGLQPLQDLDYHFYKCNSGDLKRMDSRLMAAIRKISVSNAIWHQMGLRSQEMLSSFFGMRPGFNIPIRWNPETLQGIAQQIGDDMLAFLEHTCQPISKWPKFKNIVSSMPPIL